MTGGNGVNIHNQAFLFACILCDPCFFPSSFLTETMELVLSFSFLVGVLAPVENNMEE